METNNLRLRLAPTFNLLKITFGIVPIVAGLDKFVNLLTTWENYLNPGVAAIIPFSPHTFMILVGIIEIVAGIIVLTKPAIGGYIVAAWLTLIGLTLLFSGTYLDVAVRDFVMAIGAFSLAKIARIVS
ncbi:MULTISPECIES: hypothetical protein [Flavobacterium]|jgi:hypothetical protein|uniref:tRNA (5-methylaminomethyl-2-thiouridylate)-methyltransferase n=1 Tax=Flavobacterium piscisymbiosum TaxID=2893753 RepID=A0ABS8MHY5_9FLAO|nr:MULTISPECIES: hypothetical protein [unclassified Flavobacterium]KRB55422.1 tRNA (5-methylaminomethyl-2-thiouridylate)-methyltransferase [Flavobacterium sp. Root186]MCC9064968.1 hypothetical protein [Flavobacterium sp. F-30]